jgi:hypothetical protein
MYRIPSLTSNGTHSSRGITELLDMKVECGDGVICDARSTAERRVFKFYPNVKVSRPSFDCLNISCFYHISQQPEWIV